MTNSHVAIGTSALSIAASAAAALISHARARTVKWRCALIFAAAGSVSAFDGSTLGKAIDGQRLLFLFAIVMIVVGLTMLRGRGDPGNPDAVCTRTNAPKVVGFGLGSGPFSGFFGIGGGFLIAPGLVAATGMPMVNAIGSSLVAVTAFGLTTATSYAISGLIDWLLAAGTAAPKTANTVLSAAVLAASNREIAPPTKLPTIPPPTKTAASGQSIRPEMA